MNGQGRFFKRAVFNILGLAIIVLPLFFVPFSVLAQDSATTGTLTGTIRDTSGAGIPGASIALRNQTLQEHAQSRAFHSRFRNHHRWHF